MGLAAYGLRTRAVWAYVTLALAGLPAQSVFLLVNIALASDFVVVIGLVLGLYLLALILAFKDVLLKDTR